jgi:hypothetical protein
MIKKTFSIVCIIAGGLALIFAQTNQSKQTSPPLPPSAYGGLNSLPARGGSSGVSVGRTSSYDKKNPPPLSLPDAYALALAELGSDTNQNYCISAACSDVIPPIPNEGTHGQGGWTFEFSNTNGIQKRVFVYFDKARYIDEGKRVGGIF